MDKFCVLCQTSKDIELFEIRRKKRKDGTVYEFKTNRCSTCNNRLKHEKRKANPKRYEKYLEGCRRRAKASSKRNPEGLKQRRIRFINKKIDNGGHGNYWRSKRYGIGLEDFNLFRAQQEYKCKICKRTEQEIGDILHIDHCHKTGKVRGLLCSNCNRGLGFFAENQEALINGAEYLRLSKLD